MTSSSETIPGTGTKRAKEKHEKLKSLLGGVLFFPVQKGKIKAKEDWVVMRKDERRKRNRRSRKCE